ncbi:MAG: hypothetical protein HY820_15835 [Acidobacteria bacterium]|nr:hypothetical protein [Acidobacteriota bacterium]
MTATAPKQAEVDQIAKEFAPDVVRIRLEVGQDWAEYPALYFRVIVSDDVARSEHPQAVTQAVRAAVEERLQLSGSEWTAYFNFRTVSEQAKLKEASWE